MRHRLKSRKNPRGRPHLKQRRITLLLNFGFRSAFTIIDRFAILDFVTSEASQKILYPEGEAGSSCIKALWRLITEASSRGPVLRPTCG
jgi:hypothetical protein